MAMVTAFAHEFDRHRRHTEQALQGLSDEDFFRQLGPSVNSIALIIKHVAGNLASRWRDFLTSDGDKPDRDRDGEFVLSAADTRTAIMASWDAAWAIVVGTLASLSDADLERQVMIRSEPHSVFQALLRSTDHTAYHTGQILYLARLFKPDAPWQTIAPGQSGAQTRGKYLSPPPAKP